MKKGDFLWGLALLPWIIILVIPEPRTMFIAATESHAYIGGFAKFFILATMGDLLGARVLNGNWEFPKGIFFRAVIWGVIGLMITLVFTVFSAGVTNAQNVGRLPFKSSSLMHAFFTSSVMNLTFAPAMFIFHKFTDLFIDIKYEKKGGSINLKELTDRADWYTLVSFSMLKTIPFFWIPCHTIVFLMPPQYRVLASAFLSIALGLLLAIAKKGKSQPVIIQSA